MTETDDKTKQEQPNKAPETSLLDSPLRRKHFWAHPWFILGAIVFTLSVILTLVNNSEITINLIVAMVTIRLPLLILCCALLGAAIEYFTILGPRSVSRAENIHLKQKFRILETLVKQQHVKKEK